MPADLSENTRQNYRSQRNRIQKGIDTGFYTEAELPLARLKVAELNLKLGETNDTIRGPGRPRSTSLRMPKGKEHMSPEEIADAVKKSEEELEAMTNLAKLKDPKFIPGTPEYEAKQQEVRERAEESRHRLKDEKKGNPTGS